jgi:hypothetical protein
MLGASFNSAWAWSRSRVRLGGNLFISIGLFLLGFAAESGGVGDTPESLNDQARHAGYTHADKIREPSFTTFGQLVKIAILMPFGKP